MRHTKFNKTIERFIMARLSAISKKYGVSDAKHAMTKWCKNESELAKIDREKKSLEARLAEISRKR